MKKVFGAIKALSSYMSWISGAALAFLMLLTVSDVIGRFFDRPITGTYDLTGLLGGVIIGLAIPFSTAKGTHVYMGFFIEGAPAKLKRVLLPVTHGLGIFLFLLLGWNIVVYGRSLYRSGDVSPTMHIPLYPVITCIGIACLVNCLILLQQLLAVFGKEERT